MSLSNWLARVFGGRAPEVPSPSDIVPEGSISIVVSSVGATLTLNLSKINIPFTRIPSVWMPGIPDTGSMDPVMDMNGNPILIGPADVENKKILCNFLKVGDIATYMVNGQHIMHRIVKIGQDKDGRYFIFKGDNNGYADSWSVRDDWIQYIVAGVVY